MGPAPPGVKDPVAPVVLCILDGFGIAPDGPGNAITQAATPNWDRLKKEGLLSDLQAAGEAVGLPEGQMGNSEVGHLNMGAGRIVPQDIVRIDHDIETGTFRENEAFRDVITATKEAGRPLHLLGLIGPGGVHSHERHHVALLELAKELGHQDVQVHAVLDGRDTPPKSAGPYLRRMEEALERTGVGRIASVQGRYWAMDRDERWERTERAYRALVHHEGEKAESAQAALEAAYERGETDEFVAPTIIEGARAIRAEDGIVAVNFRPDRMRQIVRALGDPAFDAFPTLRLSPRLVIMTRYHSGFTRFARVAYPPVRPRGTLGEAVARAGLRQLRIAETEKYAHVTYFINGGEEEPFENEERILVPSPKIATYDLKPEMSADEVTRRLIEVLQQRSPPELIILNYANPDMVGHTGNLESTVKAIETIDRTVGRLAEATREAGGALVITGDHGNAEEMLDEEGGIVTKHTTNPVPLLVLLPPGHGSPGLEDGILADVAPTVLHLLGLPRPESMDRHSLLKTPATPPSS